MSDKTLFGMGISWAQPRGERWVLLLFLLFLNLCFHASNGLHSIVASMDPSVMKQVKWTANFGTIESPLGRPKKIRLIMRSHPSVEATPAVKGVVLAMALEPSPVAIPMARPSKPTPRVRA